MNFHPDRASPMPGKNDFSDNRLHSASPHQNSFLNWNGGTLTGENICHFAYDAAIHLNRK
jgi:hypothetical protein